MKENFKIPWTISELIDGDTTRLTDPGFEEFLFWETDLKGKCARFGIRDAIFKFSNSFLPFFGFYKYRLSDTSSYLIVQKRKQRVRIIGSDNDNQTAIQIFEWFRKEIPFLKDTLGYGDDEGAKIPEGFEEEVFASQELFKARTLAFLPDLPEIYLNDDTECPPVMPRPLQDRTDRAFLPFENAIIQIRKNEKPAILEWDHLPHDVFVWDNQVIGHTFTEKQEKSGHFWTFLLGLSAESVADTWQPNKEMLKTIISTFGYLCHNFQKSDERPCVIIYDRTTEEHCGGNGKSRLCEALEYVRPVHEISGKHLKQGDNRFSFSGYKPNKRIVVIQDIHEKFDFSNLFNQTEDAFTVEEKGKNKIVIPRDQSPKMVITTNRAIETKGWSDERRQHLCPVGLFFGTMHKTTGRNIKSFLDNKLLYIDWDDEDWNDFYNIVAHCLQQYLNVGLSRFKDTVYKEQLMIKASYDNEIIADTLKEFINDVVTNKEGVTCRAKVIEVLNKPELEFLLNNWSEGWQTRSFKKVAGLLGYQINPGRPQGRWQQKTNGVVEDWYRLVPQENTLVNQSQQES